MRYIILIILLIGIATIWIEKSHELGFEKTSEKIGKIEMRVGIEEKKNRDFTLMVSLDPCWYFTFELCLWSIYVGVVWSRDSENYPDCDHEGTKCFYCGNRMANQTDRNEDV